VNTMNERLDKIVPRIQEVGFFEGRKLGNELNFHIFDYPPQMEISVRDWVARTKKRLNKDHQLHQIVEIDLYDTIIEVLERKGFLEKTFAFEEKKGSDYVFDKTQKALRLTLPNDLLVANIKARVNPNDIIFITGVGKAFPIIRSHNLLNTLHPVLDQNPVILFFPGEYDGQSLSLFNLNKEDNYYRAFRLVD